MAAGLVKPLRSLAAILGLATRCVSDLQLSSDWDGHCVFLFNVFSFDQEFDMITSLSVVQAFFIHNACLLWSIMAAMQGLTRPATLQSHFNLPMKCDCRVADINK